jgi:hypothetical protein
VKELRAEALLELLDARSDVRLHPVQRRRGARDAALLGHRLEDLQLDKSHVHELRMIDSELFILQERRRHLHWPA